MLTYQDEQRVKVIVKEELKPIDKKIDRIENNLDKVLKIVTSTQEELILTQKVVKQHDKRLTTIEKTLDIPSPHHAFV